MKVCQSWTDMILLRLTMIFRKLEEEGMELGDGPDGVGEGAKIHITIEMESIRKG